MSVRPSLLLAVAPVAIVTASAQAQPTRPDSSAAADSTRRAQALEALTVTAARARADAPIAQTTLDTARLRRDYSGQDVPLVLRQTPSITAFSESGSLLNYSYFRLRGIDQSRVNMTLDWSMPLK